MKQNKLLSLIAALLVAIMLVPSFAMAEETAAAATPSLSIPTDKQAFSVKLTGAKKGSSLDPEITVTVKDMPEGYTDASIAWTSASPDYVSITSAPQVITGAEPTSAVPNITIKDLCSGVTITGKLSYTDKDGHKWPEKASTSFTVTATQVDSKEIKFKEKTYTYQQYQVQPTEYTYPDYSYTIPYYEYFGNKIEWDDPDDSTYGQSGPVWSVNNTTVATVSSTGTVYFTGEPGEVTLTVATRDSTPKSASTTIKVVADEDDPTPAQPGESSYTFLGFRAQTINRVGTDSFSADSYLDKSPDWWEINVDPKYPNFNDALIWESTDTSVATVDAEGYVTVLKKGETEIKVKSRKNPDTVKASVKVVIDAEEEEEEDVIPYSTFEYAKETPTMLIGGRLDTQTYYLTRSPKKVSPKEKITYATSDPKVAIVDKDGVVTALAVGEVTITATTAYSGQSTQLTIKVTENPDAETIEYDTFKFDTAELSLYPYVSGIGMIPSYNSANLVSHLIRDPDPTTQTVANLEKFVFTSGDSAIAYVENNVVFARRTGEVTITARTSHSKQTAKITIKVLDPTAAPAEAFEDIWFYNESPLVLYTTKNVSFNQADLSKFIATKGGNDILSPDKYDLVSLDPGIAKLNGTTLIAVAPGETTVVATSHYGAKTAELKVVVKEEEELHVPYESVEFSISDLTLYVGENSPLSELNVSGYVVTDTRRSTIPSSSIARIRPSPRLTRPAW